MPRESLPAVAHLSLMAWGSVTDESAVQLALLILCTVSPLCCCSARERPGHWSTCLAASVLGGGSMFSSFILYLAVWPEVINAFSGGWFPLTKSMRQNRLHACTASTFSQASTLCSTTGSGFVVGAMRPSLWRPLAAASSARRQVLQLMPNEYEAFFNKTSKLGADATRDLAPGERARRAMEVRLDRRKHDGSPSDVLSSELWIRMI